MQNNQKEPIEGYEVCPHCGSDKKIVGDYITELKEAGVINKDSFPSHCGVWEIPFLDLQKFSLIQAPNTIRMYPVVRILWDICGECKKPIILGAEFTEKGVMQQKAPVKT